MEKIRLISDTDPTTNANESQVPIWRPELGPEFERYVSKVHTDHAARLRVEAPRILSACIRPGEQRTNAGLVLGYVQSGKTSSFTAVSALARDNGYKCIIILGGTSNILLRQTRDRLRAELDASVDVGDAAWRWLWCESPKPTDQAAAVLSDRLRTFADSTSRGDHPLGGVPLVTIMKQKKHLENLYETLKALELAYPGTLREIPTLIVDDEAHMHSPDVNLTAGDFSAIYLAIRNLRQLLPQHTLLQYTATPQANLLAALDDELSPDFVRLLTTGDNYAGGIEFFRNEGSKAICTISRSEQISVLGSPPPAEPPDSLKKALAQFLLIATDNYLNAAKNGANPASLSMLTHGAGSNHIHQLLSGWLSSLISSWKNLITDSSATQDLDDLVTTFLLPAYQDIATSATPALLPYPELFQSLHRVLELTKVQSINQQGSNSVNWNLSPYNIINGGNLLGVGFTVKGLVVTHMLRTLGGGQGDTLQQRGRFFGYRKDWLNRTRVWLPEDVRYHFAQYIDQEEYLRDDLKQFDEANLSLRGWKRRFRLDPNAKLCRKNAIRLEMFRFATRSSWVEQDFMVEDPSHQASNRELVESFLRGSSEFGPAISLSESTRANAGQTPATRHVEGLASLARLKMLLASYVVREENRMDFEVIRSLIDDHENDETYKNILVVDIAAGNTDPYRRRRAIRDNGGFDLMQGAGSRDEGIRYGGDRAVRDSGVITLQIHRVDHGPNDNEIEHPDLTYLAISLPLQLEDEANAWVHQR
jgi:hypothetical protein